MKVVNLRREKVLQKEKRTKQFKEDATKWYYWKDIETTKWFEENITNGGKTLKQTPYKKHFIMFVKML